VRPIATVDAVSTGGAATPAGSVALAPPDILLPREFPPPEQPPPERPPRDGDGAGAPEAPAVPRPRGRHEWVDAGRGLAIVLVVLVHSRDWLDTVGLPMQVWGRVNETLGGLRMPLFFMVSGLLGAKWTKARWADLFTGKLVFLIWVYLIWQPIGLGAALVADQFTGAHSSVTHFVIALAATVVRPRSELWFLWALVLYFVLLRAGSRWPLWVQLVPVVPVSAVWFSGLVPDGNLGWNGVPKFYLFFLLGARYRTTILRLAAQATTQVWRSLAAFAAWGAGTAVVAVTGIFPVLGVGVLAGMLGMVGGVGLAVRLAPSRLLRYLGSRTLPVYLAHTPIIIVMAWFVHSHRHAAWVGDLTPELPLVFTLLAVPLTLGLYEAVRRTPVGFLYAPPALVLAVAGRIVNGRRPDGRHALPAPRAHNGMMVSRRAEV